MCYNYGTSNRQTTKKHIKCALPCLFNAAMSVATALRITPIPRCAISSCISSVLLRDFRQRFTQNIPQNKQLYFITIFVCHIVLLQ